MPKFQYLHFTAGSEVLQEQLNIHGADGWRLHSCDPVTAVVEDNRGVILFVVVMDKMTSDESNAHSTGDTTVDSESTAMKMSG